ncbi:hypothetical protein ABZ612_02695 [Streptomyces avermitilis]|uniref:hypothetical protein n=1 Tax=Streptomyces avermitilis TaxID=33903 RepID=UPI0033F52E68
MSATTDKPPTSADWRRQPAYRVPTAALANDRLVGHTRWFGGEDGTRLLNRIRTRL